MLCHNLDIQTPQTLGQFWIVTCEGWDFLGKTGVCCYSSTAQLHMQVHFMMQMWRGRNRAFSIEVLPGIMSKS